MAKIGHIIHEGSGGGGATLSLNYFPLFLNHYDTFAITGREGDLSNRLQNAGVRSYPLPLDRPIPCTLSIPRIASVLRTEKPDLVFVHGQWGGFGGAVAARLAGIKRVIYHTHMPSFYTDWDPYRIARNRMAEAMTCNLSTKLICPSLGNRYQYLIRQLKAEEDILCIPNGLDTARIQPVNDRARLRRELNLPESAPLVVSVGRLSDQKRVDWLLQAWVQIEKNFPEAVLVIVGDGPERTPLEILSHQLELHNLYFVGRQPEAHRYFQAADCGVITTLFEAQPYALLEAMACGCPMVGTSSDGVRDTLQQNITGLCVPVGSPDAISTALGQLLSDPELRQRMGKQARQTAVSKYDLKMIIQRQFDLVEQLLKK